MRGWHKISAASCLAALISCTPPSQPNPETAASQPLTITDISTNVDLSYVLMSDSEGCKSGPMAQFGRYIGHWEMTSTTLSRDDGKTWIDGGKAKWKFTCVGNGIAIQDFWMPEAGGYGTNLRMYDPKAEKWDIAWVSTATPAMSHISAKQQDNGDILMTYVAPTLSPMRRITFFSPTAEGWDWQLEISQDGGDNWIAVVKMQARPA